VSSAWVYDGGILVADDGSVVISDECCCCCCDEQGPTYPAGPCCPDLDLPASLKLTISNSTCADIPNRTVDLTHPSWGDSWDAQIGILGPDDCFIICYFKCVPTGPDSYAWQLSSWCFSSIASSASCDPFSVSGTVSSHACCTCAGGSSFDWQVTT